MKLERLHGEVDVISEGWMKQLQSVQQEPAVAIKRA